MELDFEDGAEGKGVHGLDVAAEQAKVGGGGAEGRVAVLEMKLDWDFHFYAGIASPLRGEHGANPLAVC